MLLYDERELVRVNCLKMLEKGLTKGTSGNISVFNREKGLFAISPSSMDYYQIRPEDVVVMDLEGKIVDGTRKPSIENVMHRIYYVEREDVNAVVHTHSTFATAVSCLGEPLPAVTFLVRLSGSYEVPCAPYAKPGSEELARLNFETGGHLNAVLLESHGLITAGPNIDRAMFIAEEIEEVAKLYCITRAIGTPKIVPKEMMGF
ncbi:MAG: class II aldolase/adducin family protein [Clostridia bacterium]|nr:class II aldolase/adducin family protein [Clostridia bacterium]